MHTQVGSGQPGGGGGALTHRPRRSGRLAAAAVALCVLLAALGALAGYVLSTRGGEEVRTAEAVVLLRPLEGNAFNPEGVGSELVNMETEAQLVGSTVVTGLAAERLGVPELADEIRAGVSSTVPANTQLVRITATGADDEEAVERAQVLSETFLAYRSERAESDVFDRGARLREEIRSREQQRRDIVEKLGSTGPDTPQRLVREQRISEITTQLAEFRVQLAQLEAASTDAGQVVTSASVVAPGLLSGPVVMPVLGAVLGLAVGLLLVSGRRRLDERVHGPDDLVQAGVPVLGRLPLASDERPQAVAGIRAAVLAAEPARPLVVGVAGGAARDADDAHAATADLAGELALSLRRAGMVVAVLDLAPRPGASHATSSGPLHDEPLLPLSLLLDAEHELPEALARREASGLPIAVVNDLGPDDLADRVSSPEMRSLMKALRGVADAVVVDIGSLNQASAQSLVGTVDAVVLTVREGSATLGELESSLRRTPTWGGRLLGVVCLAGAEGRRDRSARPSGGDDPGEHDGPEADERPVRSRGGGGSATAMSTLAPEGPP